MKNLYDINYFENGIESGISCYVNYRWMPDQTISMCNSMIQYAEIKKNDSVLDYGCAKGFTVRALNELGYRCRGVDVSRYAIDNADPTIIDKVELIDDENSNVWFKENKFDVIVCKDVLEHVSYENIDKLLTDFRNSSKKLFVIVPLAKDGCYIAPEYEQDVTHIIREDNSWWTKKLLKANFRIIKNSFIVKGIKDNWSHYPQANGFFLCE